MGGQAWNGGDRDSAVQGKEKAWLTQELRPAVCRWDAVLRGAPGVAITVPVLLALCSPPNNGSVSSVEPPVLLAGSKAGVHRARGKGSRERVYTVTHGFLRKQ